MLECFVSIILTTIFGIKTIESFERGRNIIGGIEGTITLFMGLNSWVCFWDYIGHILFA